MQKSVAIVIPCYNEENYIVDCINSCMAQTVLKLYPNFSLEILVCDGMSTDRTRLLVDDLAKSNSIVRLINNEKKITPIALNLGIKSSSADVIIILGAHSTLYSNYVENCLKALHEHPDAGCVGGIIESEFSDDNSAAIGKAQTSSFGVGNAYFRTGAKSGYVDTVAFGAYRREVFLEAGYFDEELIRNQDDEMNFRVLIHGFKIYLDLSIKSKYFVRASFSKLFKQYYQYGFWKVYANKKNSSITTIRQLIPFGFVSFLFFFPFLFLFSKYFICAYFSLLFLYLIMAFLFSLSGKSSFYKIVFSFLILHFSYGFGYLYGVIYFIVLGSKPPNQQTISR